jgi:hypothetical protein
MTFVDNQTNDVSTAVEGGAREAWVKPEIVSFDAVVATQTNNGTAPGDGLSNAS